MTIKERIFKLLEALGVDTPLHVNPLRKKRRVME